MVSLAPTHAPPAAAPPAAPPNLLSLPTELLVRILADVHRPPVSAEAADIIRTCRAFQTAFASDAALRARRVAFLLDPGWIGKRAALAAMRQLAAFVRVDAAALRRFEDEEHATARLRSVAFLLSRCPAPPEPPSAKALFHDFCGAQRRVRTSDHDRLVASSQDHHRWTSHGPRRATEELKQEAAAQLRRQEAAQARRRWTQAPPAERRRWEAAAKAKRSAWKRDLAEAHEAKALASQLRAALLLGDDDDGGEDAPAAALARISM